MMLFKIISGFFLSLYLMTILAIVIKGFCNGAGVASLRYSVLASAAVILKLIQGAFSNVIALFVDKDGHLPGILGTLFEPDDTPAIGDQMFADREMAWTKGMDQKRQYYWRAVYWGRRNPAYGFDSKVAGLSMDNPSSLTPKDVPNIDIGYNDQGTCIAVLGSYFRTCTNKDGTVYFEWKIAKAWNTNYAWMASFGWNLTPGSVVNSSIRNLRIDIRPKITLQSRK